MLKSGLCKVLILQSSEEDSHSGLVRTPGTRVG